MAGMPELKLITAAAANATETMLFHLFDPSLMVMHCLWEPSSFSRKLNKLLYIKLEFEDSNNLLILE